MSETDKHEARFWDSLEILDDQHWLARTFKGRGDLEFSGALRLSGEWRGSVRSTSSDAHLFVLAGAMISGSIESAFVTVEGELQDVDLQAEVLRAVRGCRIRGRIRARRLIVEEGAIIEGRIVGEGGDRAGSHQAEATP